MSGRESSERRSAVTIDLEATAERLADAFPQVVGAGPEVHLVLGSGLSALAERVDQAAVVPFSELPGFPSAGVVGHAGRFVMGRLGGRPVLVQAGRFHLYEGHAPGVVVAPVRVAAMMGVRTTILTNAAGGIDRTLRPGDLLMIDDHLNLSGRSPLAGPVLDGEERFPDMSEPYDRRLQALTEVVAADLRIPLARGTYAGLLGPSYETAAEIRMLDRLGGSAVGMSTVAETIVARARGLRVLAFSLITNPATGTGSSSQALDHAEVLEIGRAAGARLAKIIEGVLRRLET